MTTLRASTQQFRRTVCLRVALAHLGANFVLPISESRDNFARIVLAFVTAL